MKFFPFSYSFTYSFSFFGSEAILLTRFAANLLVLLPNVSRMISLNTNGSLSSCRNSISIGLLDFFTPWLYCESILQILRIRKKHIRSDIRSQKPYFIHSSRSMNDDATGLRHFLYLFFVYCSCAINSQACIQSLILCKIAQKCNYYYYYYYQQSLYRLFTCSV